MRSRSRAEEVAGACVVLVACLLIGGLAVMLMSGVFRRPRPVTEGEARAYLDRMIAAGLAGDVDAVCGYNGAPSNCYALLENNPATVPKEPPTSITATYEGDGADESSGWVFTVRGRDGRGLPYRTEVMVFRDHEGNLKAINAAWWTSAQVVSDPDEDPFDASPAAARHRLGT